MTIPTVWNKKTLFLFATTVSALIVVSGWSFYLDLKNLLIIGLPALLFNFFIIMALVYFNSYFLKKSFTAKYHFPFSNRRFLLIAATGTIASVLIILLIYATVFSLIELEADYKIRTEIKLPVILVFSILFYGINAWKIKSGVRIKELKIPPAGDEPVSVSVKTGNRHIIIPVENIAWLTKKNDASLIKLKTGEEYITYDTLTKFFSTYLKEADFFRADRKYIIQKKSIQGYTRLPNRNLSLTITPGSPQDVTVNKNIVKEFLEWMNK